MLARATCELAILDMSSRVGATSGPSPTGIFSVLRLLYTNQGGAKVLYQENGLLWNQDCFCSEVCWHA